MTTRHAAVCPEASTCPRCTCRLQVVVRDLNPKSITTQVSCLPKVVVPCSALQVNCNVCCLHSSSVGLLGSLTPQPLL